MGKLGRFGELGQEKSGEQTSRQHIDLDVLYPPVGRLLVGLVRHAGVEDRKVEPVDGRVDLPNERAHALKAIVVELDDLDLTSERRNVLVELSLCSLGLFGVPDGEDKGRDVKSGEMEGGLVT